jgi:hypothetical protein
MANYTRITQKQKPGRGKTDSCYNVVNRELEISRKAAKGRKGKNLNVFGGVLSFSLEDEGLLL